jgi:HSP20 family protein
MPNSFSNLVPPVDIIEAASDYEIRLAVPGLEPSDFTVEINDGVLTICADREEQKQTPAVRRVKKSIFVRSFILPTRADESHIASFYNDGILKVRIPKMTFAS